MTDKSEKIDFNPPSSSIKKKNSIISNLKEGQVSNSIDVELITKIKQVKEKISWEIVQLMRERLP